MFFFFFKEETISNDCMICIYTNLKRIHIEKKFDRENIVDKS